MLPLEGVRVVEIAQNLAGPMVAEILAHMGADVIKIERPEGDDARRWGPPFFKGTSPGYLAVNANKRSITVDLKDKAAVERLFPLIGEADVLVQNLKPGSLEALGLGSDVVTKRFPKLIYCSVWAFGRTGPLKLKPGYEPMVQAFSGLDDDERRRGRAADAHRHLDPRLRHRDVGRHGRARRARRPRDHAAAAAWSTPRSTRRAWPGSRATTRASARSGVVPERHRTGSNRVVPFQAFETKTGPVIVAAGNDRLFVKLATVLGHPEWVTDPRFKTNAARVENRPALCKMIDEIMAGRSKGEWIDLLEAEGVPCSIINSLPDGRRASPGRGARHDPADAGRGLLARGAAGVVRRRAAEDSLRRRRASASTTSRLLPGSAGGRANAWRRAAVRR